MDKSTLERIQWAILGSMLTQENYIGEALSKLSPNDFMTAGGVRDLYNAISDLHFSGAPVNSLTLLHKLGDDYQVVIDNAMQNAATKPDYYCEMLQEYTQLHNIQTAAYNLALAEDLDESLSQLDKLNGLALRKNKLSIVSALDAATDFMNRMDSTQKPEYLAWGMKELDSALYTEPGDFVVIGGYASAGKTLLSLQFAIGFAEKYRVGYFTLETNPRKVTDRLMSHLAQVPISKIKKRDIGEDDCKILIKAANRLSQLKLEMIPASGMTVRDIQAVALSQRYKIIFVDYLQLVKAPGKNRYEIVTNISQELHTLAQSTGITVVALAQLTRPDKSTGKPQPPNMSSFRESGQIEQDADVAMLLYPLDPNDNRSNRVLKLAKNKEGDRGKIELKFKGETMTLIPEPPSFHQQMQSVTKAIRQQELPPAAESEQVTFTEVTTPVKLPF